MDMETATREELIDYGVTLGIKLSMRMNTDTMKTRINAALSAEQADQNGGRSTTRIIIAKSAEAGGEAAVTLTHNAVHTVIVRGEPVDCPDHLIEQLDHATKTVLVQSDNGEMSSRVVQRYPYTRV